MQKQDTTIVRRSTPAVEDCGKVQLGGVSPSLPVRAAPASTADQRKVRLGGMSPLL